MRRITIALALAASIGLTGATVAQSDTVTGGTHLFPVELATGELVSVGTIGTDETVARLPSTLRQTRLDRPGPSRTMVISSTHSRQDGLDK